MDKQSVRFWVWEWWGWRLVYYGRGVNKGRLSICFHINWLRCVTLWQLYTTRHNMESSLMFTIWSPLWCSLSWQDTIWSPLWGPLWCSLSWQDTKWSPLWCHDKTQYGVLSDVHYHDKTQYGVLSDVQDTIWSPLWGPLWCSQHNMESSLMFTIMTRHNMESSLRSSDVQNTIWSPLWGPLWCSLSWQETQYGVLSDVHHHDKTQYGVLSDVHYHDKRHNMESSLRSSLMFTIMITQYGVLSDVLHHAREDSTWPTKNTLVTSTTYNHR